MRALTQHKQLAQMKSTNNNKNENQLQRKRKAATAYEQINNMDEKNTIRNPFKNKSSKKTNG